MAKGRPAKTSSVYKVSIHKNNGHYNATTLPFTMGEDGKRHYSYKYWGALEEGKRFRPNSTYFYTSPEERRKLIFPDDWDLSEITTLSGIWHIPMLRSGSGK